VALTGFRLTPPNGVTVEATEADDGWVTRMEGRTLVWSGGNVPGGDEGVFTFRASLDTADRRSRSRRRRAIEAWSVRACSR
jgi:hypothetical protein